MLLATPYSRAQLQPPNPQELKMTSDPKAPGADAVYLYREEHDDELQGVETYYERIKVLTEKGKEMATISMAYVHGLSKVTDIEGRTIHADGTIIPLNATPSDLMNLKAKDVQVNSIVFTLPDVQVGSVLEYRLKLRYELEGETPTWEIQQHHFVHQAHYYLNPNFSHVLYREHLGGNAKVVKNGVSYTLDISDVPPLPDEDWMPPLNTIRWRVMFYTTWFENASDFWTYARREWWVQVSDFIDIPGGLRKAAEALVATGDTDDQKSHKIYAAVMKLENTDFGRAKSKAERKAQKIKDIQRANDVWKRQSGNSADIALLYVAMARAVGLKAYPMQVVDRNKALYDQDYYSTDQLDDFIAVVKIDSKDLFLDPGEKMCPYGRLHWKHTLTVGFRMADDGVMLSTTPAASFRDAVTTRVANLELDAQGNVTGTARFVMTGPEALYWRQLALQNDEEEVKKRFNESIRSALPEGVAADFDHFLALDEADSDLIGIVQVSGSLGAVTGKRFILPGLFFASRAEHPFVALEKRVTPIDVHHAQTLQDQVTYKIPAEYTPESLPDAANASWPAHATLKIESSAKQQEVRVVRMFAYNYVLLKPEDYSNLHDFYQKAATADQEQLVLVKATPAKGN